VNVTTLLPDDATFDPWWLRGLCDRAQAWVAATEGLKYGERKKGVIRVPTDGYVDLSFSFGLASLGDAPTCRELLQRAESVLGQQTVEVHRWLQVAFRYRITQALDGRAHRGIFPVELRDSLERLPMMDRYVADRLRSCSCILEPDFRPDPYRNWGSRFSPLEAELNGIREDLPPDDIARRFEQLFAARATHPQSMGRVLAAALNLAAVVGEPFARSLLKQVPAAYERFSPDGRQRFRDFDDRVFLLREALKVTKFFPDEDTVLFATRQLVGLLEQGCLRAVGALAEPCLRLLRKHNRRAELEQVCQQLAIPVLLDTFAVSLPVAASWGYLGQHERAEPVFESARTLLFGGRQKKNEQSRVQVALDYVAAVVSQSPQTARGRLEELFERMLSFWDGYVTKQYYALTHLMVIEPIILAVIDRNEPTPLRVSC
jgi:hypothetical protein